METMKKLIAPLALILIPTLCFSVTLSNSQYQAILDRLQKDKEALEKQDKKWNSLRKADPKVEYKVEKDALVVEKITIPVENDNPLEYSNNFTVIVRTSSEGFFPLRLRLWGGGVMYKQAATLLTSSKMIYAADVRLAFKFIGIAPIPIKYLNGFGFNALVGLQGFGLSLSWDLPWRIVSSTSIHFGYGWTYKMVPQFSAGISLNF